MNIPVLNADPSSSMGLQFGINTTYSLQENISAALVCSTNYAKVVFKQLKCKDKFGSAIEANIGNNVFVLCPRDCD